MLRIEFANILSFVLVLVAEDFSVHLQDIVGPLLYNGHVGEHVHLITLSKVLT